MKRRLLLAGMTIALLVAACGGDSSAPESSASQNDGDFYRSPAATAAAFPTATPAPFRGAQGPEGAPAPRLPAQGGDASPALGILDLQIADRMVVAVASIGIEVEDVEASITKVRAAAEGLGGYVEQLTSAAGKENTTATMTVRVPQPRFFDALDHLDAVGKITNRSVGSNDVTDQFIDLQARLKSSQTQEASLLRLMERVSTVSDVLTLEREIARIRSEVERLQGQLNFLERRVDLATITVSLNKPVIIGDAGRAPRADIAIKSRNPESAGAQVKTIVQRHNGILDTYTVSTQDGKSTVYASFRVLPASFAAATSEARGLGKVTHQSVDEGKTPEEGADVPQARPTAVISLSLLQQPAPFPAWALALSIGLPILLGLLLVAGAVTLYRRSVRRTATHPAASS